MIYNFSYLKVYHINTLFFVVCVSDMLCSFGVERCQDVAWGMVGSPTENQRSSRRGLNLPLLFITRWWATSIHSSLTMQGVPEKGVDYVSATRGNILTPPLSKMNGCVYIIHPQSHNTGQLYLSKTHR